MGKKGLVVNIVVVGIVAIILIVILRGFSEADDTVFILEETTFEEKEVSLSEYKTKMIVPIIEKDSYGVRFGDIIFYPELDQFYIPLIAADVDDEEYEITVREHFGGRYVDVFRTGVKSELYYSYENLFWFRDGYTGTYFVEILLEGSVIERMKIEQD